MLAAFPNPAMDCVTVDFSARSWSGIDRIVPLPMATAAITDAGPHSAGTQRVVRYRCRADLASGPHIARISTPLETLHTTIVVVGPGGGHDVGRHQHWCSVFVPLASR
ncbi:MAG: hypothetical protein IPI55_16055 [Flavobacteriales bacterium]|nr:hypothetical protein [Flavobacteriales bacterium]